MLPAASKHHMQCTADIPTWKTFTLKQLHGPRGRGAANTMANTVVSKYFMHLNIKVCQTLSNQPTITSQSIPWEVTWITILVPEGRMGQEHSVFQHIILPPSLCRTGMKNQTVTSDLRASTSSIPDFPFLASHADFLKSTAQLSDFSPLIPLC